MYTRYTLSSLWYYRTAEERECMAGFILDRFIVALVDAVC